MRIFALPQIAATRSERTLTSRAPDTGPHVPSERLSLGEAERVRPTGPAWREAPSMPGLLRTMAFALVASMGLAGAPGAAMAASAQPTTEQQSIRPEVQSFLQELKDGTITGVKHTTRGLEMPAPYEPQAPQPFGAGRHQFDFVTADGQKRAFIVDTESRVGHLAQVVPGQTDVGGSIQMLSDPADSQSVGAPLTLPEQDAMLESLYAKAGQPMKLKTAQHTDLAISAVSAVRYSGQGAEAVARAHVESLSR